MQILRVTIIGIVTGVTTLGLVGAVLGAAAGGVVSAASLGNPEVVKSAAIKLAVYGVIIGLVAGLVAGLLLGITKPTMKGWLIGLVIGLLLCVTVGLLVDFSNYPSLNPFYSRDRFFLALTLATIFGIGGGIIGCVIGAIADLIFFALVPDQ